MKPSQTQTKNPATELKEKEKEKEKEKGPHPLSKHNRIYIYAEVDIDKAFQEITLKSKKIQKYLETNKLDYEFVEKMRNYKNLRICLDNEIQKYIYNKELTPDLRLIKKNVFCALEDFLIDRFTIYNEDVEIHNKYKTKVIQVETRFMTRMEELMKGLD